MDKRDTNWISRYFRFAENRTGFRKEITGGSTTFLALSYIVFVQPAVLSQAGMDFNAVMVATCLSAALATLIMGVFANYPIALAPGMGENFFFTFSVVIGAGLAWPQAMSAVFYAGVLFVILTISGVREAILNAIPDSLKMAMAVGIGLFIVFIGLNDGGIFTRNHGAPALFNGLVSRPVVLALIGMIATGILVAVRMRRAILAGISITTVCAIVLEMAQFGDFTTQVVWLALGGTVITVFLNWQRIPGAILWGILATAAGGLAMGLLKMKGIVSTPPSLAPTF